MHFRADWRRVLWRAWSVRLWAFAILVQMVDFALPWFRASLPISDQWFGVVTVLSGVAGIIARPVTQQGITPPEAVKEASDAD